MRENAAQAPGGAEVEETRAARILIVDDDPQVRAMFGYALRQEGFAAEEASSGEGALEALERYQADLIVLDTLMPGLSALETCRRIRERWSLPIIMLSTLGHEAYVVAGLRAGADHFCTKPVSLAQLVARIRALLRRRELDAASVHHVLGVDGAELRVDVEARQAIVRGHAVDLSPREFGLLERLARSPGRVVSHAELLQHVWGSRSPEHLAQLRSYIKLLREKIEADPHHPRYIRARPRLGYMLGDRPQGPVPAEAVEVAPGRRE